jgi:hypothetical protein
MGELCVVHLLWGPLGTEPVERFAAGYCAHPAGRDHEVLVVFNGFGAEEQRASARAALGGVGDGELHLPAPMQDLDAYRRALDQTDARRVLFLNSYSEVRADGWLDLLARHAETPGVGMVAATGSWESQLSPAPLALKALRVARFGPFPNPHLRTNAFLLGRELGLSLRWPRVRRKEDALALENGRRSLSRQVLARGLQALVVGRDGEAYGPARYREARTYRTGAQENLLVADNRTRGYEAAPPALRRRLEELAWGSAQTA